MFKKIAVNSWKVFVCIRKATSQNTFHREL